MKTKSTIVSALSVCIILGISVFVGLRPAESQTGPCFIPPEDVFTFFQIFLVPFPHVVYPNINWDNVNQAQRVINKAQHWIHHDLTTPCEQKVFQSIVTYPYKVDVMKARVELIDPDGDGDADNPVPKNIVPDEY